MRSSKRQPRASYVGRSFEIVEDFFRLASGRHYDVSVIGADIDRTQAPAPMLANLPDRLLHDLAARPIKHHRSLFETPLFFCLPFFMTRKKGSAVNVMIPINRTSFVTVQPCAVTTKRDQVGERNATLVEFFSHHFLR